MSTRTTDAEFDRDYDREIFRSSLYSALWALISDKKRSGFRVSDIAEKLGKDRGYISRLFSRHENSKLNIISDLAHALDATIHIEVVDRATGQRYGAGGMMRTSRSGPSVQRHYDLGDGHDEGFQFEIRRNR